MNAFSPEDGDAWYQRNKHKMGNADPVVKAITELKLKPTKVVEIGCANGWRLVFLKELYDCRAWGVEISPDAIANSPKWLEIYPPDDRALIALGSNPDLIIHGFNLYLYDPDALFTEVEWTNNRLADGGHIIIHDFLPEHPYSRIFEHNKELRSRKMDHAQLWLAHPAYSIVRRDIYGDGDHRTHVTILKKDMANAFPLEG